MCVLEACRILSSLKNKKVVFCIYKDMPSIILNKPVGYVNY